MKFEIVKDALVNLLGTEAAGRFRVLGYQDRGTDATELLDELRSVQVFYSGGKFPKSGGAWTGPSKHDMNYEIILSVGKANKVDLSVLDNPASTPAQKASALAASQTSTELVETSYNELLALVYQILMDNRNQDLGISDPVVTSRWIVDFEKERPTDKAGYTVMNGALLYTCTCSEPFTGATPTPATAGQAIDLENEIQDEDGNVDTGKAGILEGG
jgi:hypothetical protein